MAYPIPRIASRHRHRRRRAGRSRLLRRGARPAAGEEDRQLRQPSRLPLLLRRRARHARHHLDDVSVSGRGVPGRQQGRRPDHRDRRSRCRPARSTSGGRALAERGIAVADESTSASARRRSSPRIRRAWRSSWSPTAHDSRRRGGPAQRRRRGGGARSAQRVDGGRDAGADARSDDRAARLRGRRPRRTTGSASRSSGDGPGKTSTSSPRRRAARR